MIRIHPRFCVCKDSKDVHVGGLGSCISCKECRRYHEAYRHCPACGSSALSKKKEQVACADCGWTGDPLNTLSVLESKRAAELYWKRQRRSSPG